MRDSRSLQEISTIVSKIKFNFRACIPSRDIIFEIQLTIYHKFEIYNV